MKNLKKVGLVSMVGLLFSALSLTPLALAKAHGAGAGAGAPGGFGHGAKKGWHGEKTPPGWSHGKKKGWGDAGTPPGLAKKSGSTNTNTTGSDGKEKLNKKAKDKQD